MANEVIYKSKAECIAAINTLKAVGMDALPWQLKQLKEFEEAEKQSAVDPNSQTPIWDTLRKNYPYGKMPQEKIDCVESTVNQLLEEGPHAEEPGLLLGKIQCGKTDTFEDVIGLSFDQGVDIAIVITKGTKALVKQTIMRMKHDFRFFKASDRLSQRTTINIFDVMDLKKHGLKSAQAVNKTVIVCKKNAKNLEHLMNIFTTLSPNLKQKKVIIVDDEADFASRNYRAVSLQAMTDADGNPIKQTREMEMARIAQQIDDFRKIPAFCRYLQVTATPYCLYLQPGGELNLNGKVVKPFKPRFTSLVPEHDRYIGGKQYFEDSLDEESMYSHLYHQIDPKCVDVMGHEDKRYLNNSVSSSNIYGLTYALVAYFTATAIRRIQEAKNDVDYKTSAIIHVDIDKRSHDWQRRIVTRLINDIKKAFVDEDQSDLRVWSAFDSIYKDYTQSNEKGRNQGLITVEMPSKEEVLSGIRDIFNPQDKKYHIQPVNSDEEMETLLDEETGELELTTAATIFIGGNILDRGVTIKHMLCFFYGRNPKNFQQDTVLQHARMYGARSKEDMAVMRLHTTPAIYRILVRMNTLDNQLRQWFIEGKDKEEPNAVFVGFDKNISPCATSKIKASNALTLQPGKLILPVGFWTGSNSAIKKSIEKIDKLITESSNYGKQDENGFFEIDKGTVMEILKLIQSTYVYNKDLFNTDRKNDIYELMCALEYCTSSSDNKLYAIHRTNRNLNRIRENGGWIDAPADGRTDVAPSREIALDQPVIMFIKENGAKKKNEEGKNIGWNDAPFYWPVLMTQKSLTPVMYAYDQVPKGEAAVIDVSDFFEGIDMKDVLSLTFKGDLSTFGEEGAEFSEEEYEIESRDLKETTASKYIEKDEFGNWKINPDVPFDESNYHGIYSFNNGVFPFVFRPYKYMLLRNKRDASADLMLMELAPIDAWSTIPGGYIDKNGDLIDVETKKVLAHAYDNLLSKNMEEQQLQDKSFCEWKIFYAIKKILKYKRNSQDINWDKLFEEEQENE